MKKRPVVCLNCKNAFGTRKNENIQCSKCKKRFSFSDSPLYSKKLKKREIVIQNEKQTQQLEKLLNKLKVKHCEYILIIKEISKITKNNTPDNFYIKEIAYEGIRQ